MSVNIVETFELLFDKNNNIAYKALQELKKESEKTNCVYAYMDIIVFFVWIRLRTVSYASGWTLS